MKESNQGGAYPSQIVEPQKKKTKKIEGEDEEENEGKAEEEGKEECDEEKRQ